jgi:hypothetical protein
MTGVDPLQSALHDSPQCRVIMREVVVIMIVVVVIMAAVIGIVK